MKTFVEKAVLGEGVGFGEQALISNARRNAKVKALTDLCKHWIDCYIYFIIDCAVITRINYQKLLSEEDKQESVKEYLRRISLGQICDEVSLIVYLNLY